MYSISKVAEMTGVSAYTLRYYEKIGLLESPQRKNGGIREYSESDLQFITFLNSLKKTGMSLEDIAEFIKDGCILKRLDEARDISPSIEKRITILSKHLNKMEDRQKELEGIILLTKEKLSIYHSILETKKSGDEFK